MPAEPVRLDSLFDIVLSGGPLMIPIALCSIVALAYIVERSVRLRTGRLASSRFEDELLSALRTGGPQTALGVCDSAGVAQARVVAAGLVHADADWFQREKAVEDAGAREVSRLSANLRPLVVVSMIAPLLGLLGTVWGMIEAFSNIALSEGLGKPEMLASGISQALVTTAAGLVVAIPTQAAYYYFKSRIDRFVQRTEDLYARLSETLLGARQAA
ncbi:MAG: MotA/TolQ/ExbB proton channel family protein [Planctomycetes bacterium]|nr:MotA/TolQ/ExbB proton channel family protein [Planctomycetota bacterium]